ncbi:sugar phosphate isomerase/epimerase, partial [Brachyspira hampsonii]|nr:sugar phosphate isomerase/epimerase [Brachyspira hampsonii]
HLNKYRYIKLSSLHYNGSIFDLDEKINSKNIEQMKNYIELVRNLKPVSIVMHPGVFGEGGFAKNLPNYQKAVEILGSERVKEKVAENIRYFGEFANTYGIKIAVENIFKGRIYSKIDDLIDLVNTVNMENVGFCLDVGHGNYDGINISETIRLMKDKLFELHLSDNLGDRDAHLPIGFGNIDWVSVINTLREIGYKGTATFEFFRWPIEDKKLGLKMAIETWKTFENIAINGYHTLDYI